MLHVSQREVLWLGQFLYLYLPPSSVFLSSLIGISNYNSLYTSAYNCVISGREGEVLWADVAIVLAAARAPVGPLPSTEEHVKDMFPHFLPIFSGMHCRPQLWGLAGTCEHLCKKNVSPCKIFAGHWEAYELTKCTKRIIGRNVTCDHHTDALLSANTCNIWGEGRDLAKWPLDITGCTVAASTHISYLLLTHLFWWQNVNHILERKKN